MWNKKFMITDRCHKIEKGRIFILSGPSGVGKTTIHEKILLSKTLKGRVVRSVSMTTRPKRKGEVHGRDYFFVSLKMFLYKIRVGQFLEWAKVFDQYYGTPFKQVQKLLGRGKSVLLCIDVQGAAQVMKRCPEAVSIFVKAPSLMELKKRLLKRGTENEETMMKRLRLSRQEMKQAKTYTHVVVNKNLASACCEVERIILQQTECFFGREGRKRNFDKNSSI